MILLKAWLMRKKFRVGERGKEGENGIFFFISLLIYFLSWFLPAERVSSDCSRKVRESVVSV